MKTNLTSLSIIYSHVIEYLGQATFSAKVYEAGKRRNIKSISFESA